MKATSSGDVIQAPSLREKSHLLIKLMNIEKRFPDQTELHTGFLELVNYVYRWEKILETLFHFAKTFL